MSYHRPLEGTRVLDLSRLYPGALATQRLADLGAEVVKVEQPGRGDYLRTIPPTVGGRGILHLLCDRGKSSIELDIGTSDGQATFKQLAEVADAVVEASRPGALAQKGLDFGELRETHPHLVLCSLTGFGQTGPLAGAPSHGMNMDALAGVAGLEHRDGRVALATRGYSLGVELGALNAALGITAAVHDAKITGEGVWLDVSCWDAAVDALRMRIATFLAVPEQEEERKGALYDVYEASDGQLVLFCAIEQKFWASFCRGVGRQDLLERWSGTDVDFGDASLREELEAVFVQHPADYWEDCFRAWDIPGSRILDLPELVEHPHLQARGLVQQDATGVHLVANPLRWQDDGTRPGAKSDGAPELGADDPADILARWSSTGVR